MSYPDQKHSALYSVQVLLTVGATERVEGVNREEEEVR